MDDTPEEREARIRLYAARAENGVDIFTGVPYTTDELLRDCDDE